MTLINFLRAKLVQNSSSDYCFAYEMRLSGLRRYVINDNRQSLTTKAKNADKKLRGQGEEDSCGMKVCNTQAKKSFWKRLFESKPKAKPDPKICKKKDCEYCNHMISNTFYYYIH